MRYNPALDGIRAIAIVLVVLFHAKIKGVAGGVLGVDVFFVLSGYLITRILADEHAVTGTIHVVKFYLRRARRLYPALLSMLTVYLMVAPIAFPKISFGEHLLDVAVVSTYLSDYAAAFFRMPVRLGHTWSLAIEEHFYLLWPLVLLLVLRLPRRYAIAMLFGLAVLATAWRWESVDLFHRWAFNYVRFDTRLSGLLLGGAIGLWQPKIRHPAIFGCIGVVGILFLMQTQRFYTDAALLQGMTIAELSAVALILGAPSLSFLEWPGMVWLGQMSYGWYLWHFPLMRIIRQFGVRDEQMVLLLGGGGGLALAVLSYYTVERYFRASRRDSVPAAVPAS